MTDYTVILVQGTWGDDDQWWRASVDDSFAQAVIAAGHRLINGKRAFNWSGPLGGIGPGNSDLLGWRGAGNHLYDRVDPPEHPEDKPRKLVIIAHSHGRQVVKEALQAGLTADIIIFVSGPIRKDVDAETPLFRSRVRKFVCLHGGKRDYMQVLGQLFDGRVGWKREDPSAINESFPDAGHSDLLTNPAFYHRVLKHIS